MESKILDLEAELDDETALRSTLDGTSSEKIVAAQEFLAANEALITAQHERIATLNTQIREAVVENEELEADDAQYQAIITSAPYTSLATKIAEMNAVTSSLIDFLVSKGRRGRPPV